MLWIYKVFKVIVVLGGGARFILKDKMIYSKGNKNMYLSPLSGLRPGKKFL
jgi:hypothetical protein